ncbi:MalM family protein [Balneatrix alpica]|uniref:MalM family protein n=1 Tax=Balneatrix alpica TaxID=75684 RepID=UPI00273A5885|nr:MalM family protein [Balneatrix alpica]
MFKLFSMAMLAITLTGCVGVANQAVAPASAAQPAPAAACCTELSSLPYHALEINRSLDWSLDSQAPRFNFAEGSSYVAAFKLPERSHSFVVKLHSLAGKTVLSPTVMLLDANFQQTRLLTEQDFIYVPAQGFKGDSLDTQFRIDRSLGPDPRNESYMLIYTTPAQLQGATTLVHPAKAFAKAHGVEPPNIADPIAPHAATGLLQISLQEERGGGSAIRDYLPAWIAPKAESLAQGQYQPGRQPAQPIGQALAPTPAALAQTEAYFEQAVGQALAAGNMELALQLVEEAQRVGAKRARQYFLQRVAVQPQ